MRFREIVLTENARTPAQELVDTVLGDDFVSVELRALDPTTVSVAQLWSELERGAGHGGRKMREICAAADRLGVRLKLIASPLRYDLEQDDYDDDPRGYDLLHHLNQNGLDEEQLRSWYEGMGFVFDPDHETDAVREPRRPVVENAPARRRHALFVNVISSGPLVIVRMPSQFVRWRDIMRAILRMMKSDFGILDRNVRVESLADPDDPQHGDGDIVQRLEAAFAGSPDYLKAFHLYAWDDAKGFVAVRGPTKGPVVENARAGKIPATPENIALAKAFVFRKWKERAVERGLPEPSDLSLACKFTSMFAQRVFGGKLQGNYDHQYVVLDGRIIDLNIDAEDVRALGDKAHLHNAAWFGYLDHKESMDSCRPRVEQWVKEFRAEMSRRPVVENARGAGEGVERIEVPWHGEDYLTLHVGSTTLKYAVYRNYVDIVDLDTPVADRGKGQAKTAMNALIRKADEEGVGIRLLSYPQDEVTQQGKLNAFYRKLGFAKLKKDPDGGILMFRQPRRPVMENAQDERPPVLYHGTTPYNAALIMLSGQIDENESRDEDDHHDYSVSTTEREEVAAWFYDVARAVDQPFGFVFHIDTSKIAHHMRPFEGETASENEYEWRVYGDIPLSAVTKVTLAGYQGTTKGEMRRYVAQMESDYRYQHRFDPENIVNAIMALLKKAT